MHLVNCHGYILLKHLKRIKCFIISVNLPGQLPRALELPLLQTPQNCTRIIFIMTKVCLGETHSDCSKTDVSDAESFYCPKKATYHTEISPETVN